MNDTQQEVPPRRLNLPRFFLAAFVAALPLTVPMVLFSIVEPALAWTFLISLPLAAWLVDPKDFGMDGPKFLYRR